MHVPGASPTNARKYIICKEKRWTTKLFYGFVFIGAIAGNAEGSQADLICKYLDYMDKCRRDLDEHQKLHNVTKETHCIGEFDGYICWPHTEVGTFQTAPCLEFGLSNEGNRTAYRYCLSNTSLTENVTVSFSDQKFTEECYIAYNNTTQTSESELPPNLLRDLRSMYTVGYAVSLTCLVVALLLLSVFKKLHCTRNYIHMALMVSCLMEGVIILLKDHVMDSYYHDMKTIDNEEELRQFCGRDLTGCRIVISLTQYAITAKYFWLLIEGIYLQMLLMAYKRNDRHFCKFMAF